MKMTKREMYTELVKIVKASNVANKDEFIEGLEHEVILLDRKTSRSSGPDARQSGWIEDIKKAIAEGDSEDGVSIAEIISKTGLSNQRITGLLSKLVISEKHPNATGEVVRTVIKGKPYFKMADGE